MEREYRGIHSFEQGKPQHSRKYKHVYSHALETLVDQCLDMNPKRRPLIMRLLYETRLGLLRWNEAHGVTSLMPDAKVPEMYRIRWRPEEFRLGTTNPRLLKKARRQDRALAAGRGGSASLGNIAKRGGRRGHHVPTVPETRYYDEDEWPSLYDSPPPKKKDKGKGRAR